jgi:uncharacterized protein YqhQ
MGKRKSAKELAVERKLQKKRTKENQKQKSNLPFQIGTKLMDGLIDVFAGLFIVLVNLFGLTSKLMNILFLILFVFFIGLFVYSLSGGDQGGLLVSIVAIPVMAIILYFLKKYD